MDLVNTNRLVKFFCDLVSYDSPSFHEREICDFIKRKFHEIGVEFKEDDAAEKVHGNCGNIYAYIEGEVDADPILFCGHMDTVEPCHNKKAVIENGRITSDGTTILGADDISCIVSIYEALHILKENHIPHRPIEVLFSVGEEAYCYGIEAFDVASLMSKEAYILDLSGPIGRAAYKAPTIVSFQAEFIGKSAHAGSAFSEGIHAIKAAAAAVAKIECGHMEKGILNIGTIQGGTATNIIPDSCTIAGELRGFDDGKAMELLHEVQNICDDCAKEVKASVRFTYKKHLKAYHTPMDHRVCKRLITACDTLGISAEFCETLGGSDCNCLSNHGITGLVLASSSNQCHTCQEYSDIEELKRSVQLVMQLMTMKL